MFCDKVSETLPAVYETELRGRFTKVRLHCISNELRVITMVWTRSSDAREKKYIEILFVRIISKSFILKNESGTTSCETEVYMRV